MPVDALKPYRPITDGGIQILRGREAAKTPFFLIPTPADNPAAFGIFGGICLYRGLRFGKAICSGQIERQQLKAKAHDMAMRVNQSGQHGCAASIKAEIELLGKLIFLGQQLRDFAICAHEHRVEPDDLAVLIKRYAIYILDQSVGTCRCGKREQG